MQEGPQCLHCDVCDAIAAGVSGAAPHPAYTRDTMTQTTIKFTLHTP